MSTIEVYSENFSEDLYWGSVVRFTVVRYSGGIQLRYILEVYNGYLYWGLYWGFTSGVYFGYLKL